VLSVYSHSGPTSWIRIFVLSSSTKRVWLRETSIFAFSATSLREHAAYMAVWLQSLLLPVSDLVSRLTFLQT